MGVQGIVALDFETANEQRASACSIALVRAEADGHILDQTSTLLRPADGFDYFNSYNVSIHGITPDDVRGAPTFEEALPALRSFIGGAPVVAHNMAFDYSVWNAAAAAVGQPGLEAPRLCTLRIARQILGRHDRPNDLKTLAGEFAPSHDFTHHQALDDATACIQILFGMLPPLGVSLETLVQEFALDSTGRHAPGSRFYAAGAGGRVSSSGVIDAAAVEGWEESEVLGGWGICFTGALERMNRSTAQTLVKKLGGIPQNAPSKKTRILVEGVSNPSVWRPGTDGSAKTRKARSLAEAGHELEAMNEETFFAMLSELTAAS
ncbi:exonuclease domain-containing protein [Kocuria rhizophila]|uniref:exonuclease domain-containing protein n=1 Tax=Kocuria rhizophila TaxID=72000 RepID=UPI00190A7450|nr:exonuclease domain-containing protein [Kocuria rhizophila]MBK4121511.1 3'-5' exoribonuclease [Kocuria rhizophila]